MVVTLQIKNGESKVLKLCDIHFQAGRKSEITC